MSAIDSERKKSKGNMVFGFIIAFLIVFLLATSVTLSLMYLESTSPEKLDYMAKLISEKAEEISIALTPEREKKVSRRVETAFSRHGDYNDDYLPESDFIADTSKVYETDETSAILENKTGETLLTGGSVDVYYFNQKDERWGAKKYGRNDSIGSYGCGPTAMSMVISSLSDYLITPDEMAKWSYNNGYFCAGSGSYHSLIPESAEYFGLDVNSLKNDMTKERILQELNTGHVIVALMERGHFTTSGHFIILRGTTLDGKILIADPANLDNSLSAWDISVFLDEAKTSASSGGPMWSISKKVEPGVY